MEDSQIVELFWQRSETALSESQVKYGAYCHMIANNILHCTQDCEECVNDTWERTWNSIPEQRPSKLGAFLEKITRNLAIDRYRKNTSEKRSDGQLALCLDELAECIGKDESFTENVGVADALGRFLRSLKPEAKDIFMLRYWYMFSVGEIAKRRLMSDSAVKMSLKRTRQKLKAFLESEGIDL